MFGLAVSPFPDKRRRIARKTIHFSVWEIAVRESIESPSISPREKGSREENETAPFFPCVVLWEGKSNIFNYQAFFPLADRAYDSSAQRREEDMRKRNISPSSKTQEERRAEPTDSAGVRKKRRILSSFGWVGEPGGIRWIMGLGATGG